MNAEAPKIDEFAAVFGEPEPATPQTTHDHVAHLRALGFLPFPCKPNKTPKCRWQDPEPKGGWTFAQGDLIGVRLTGDQMVLDIDDPAKFTSAGLATPVTPRARPGPQGRPPPLLSDRRRPDDQPDPGRRPRLRHQGRRQGLRHCLAPRGMGPVLRMVATRAHLG